MEAGLNESIMEQFGLDGVADIRTVSPLTLAYIGDGVYELVVRSVMVARTNTRAGLLHRQTSQLVKAEAQSRMMDILLPHLCSEEEHVFRRGRNAKSATMAKNASASDYRRATGFEALMGYLYLTGQTGRMLELIKLALDTYEPDEEMYAEAHNHHGRRHTKARRHVKGPESRASGDAAPEDEKPEDKPPEDKEPEDEKPEDKTPEDKEPEDKKPEDKTAGGHKTGG